VYALYDALDAAYLQVMVIAIPTSKKTAPWQAWKCLLFRTALCGLASPFAASELDGVLEIRENSFSGEKLE